MTAIQVYHGHECCCTICKPLAPIAWFASRVTAERFKAGGQTYEHYKLPEGNRIYSSVIPFALLDVWIGPIEPARDAFFRVLNMGNSE